LTPGTHLTSAFDPFGKPGVPRQLSYTVPDGWALLEDRPGDFVLHHFTDAAPGQSPTDSFVVLLAQPTLTVVENGKPCGTSSDAPHVGQGVDDLMGAIVAGDGVVSTPRTAVTVGGFKGKVLDLEIAPGWTGGCLDPNGQIAAVPFLLGSGPATGPTIGVVPDHPLRLILVGLTGGRTLAVAIYGAGPAQPLPLVKQLEAAMPIIESFQFPAIPAASPSSSAAG
jgi:hypothetical protein